MRECGSWLEVWEKQRAAVPYNALSGNGPGEPEPEPEPKPRHKMVDKHTRHHVGVNIFPIDAPNPPQKVHTLVSSMNVWPKIKYIGFNLGL